MGGTNVIHTHYEPERVVSDIVNSNIQIYNCVPTMLRDLSHSADLSRLSQSSLQCLSYGGEPAPLDALERVLEATDTLVQVYGQTEAPSWTAVLTKAEHHDPELRRTIGRPTPNVAWAVLDDNREVVEEPGVTGELAMQSASIAAGLLGGEAEYEERLVRDTWWLTGDIGAIDEAGYIRLHDRKKDMIISGGSNIYPAEIERVLEQHPDVREAVVFGIPSPRWGERPVAVVFGPELEGPAGDGLKAYVAEQLAKFKVPDTIVVSTDPLARRGDEGKMWKSKIKEQYFGAGS
jgi:acyl-CoA synthetase (AMP-forming)/AMP-acid ligase II